MERIQNYINGQYTNPKENKWLTNFEPATGLPLNDIPISTVADIEMAYTAAEEAFKEWSQTSAEKRSNILHNIAQLIEAQLDSLAALETKDNGKPLSLAQTIDIPRAAANFRFFANAITQFSSEAHDTLGKNTINYTLRQPLGVVGCISPWNLPLYLFTWKIAPALAAGNTVIAKPSELTPLTASKLGEIATKAGLPKGVLNIIQGPGNPSGQALISHPNIKAISFTGGTKTGAHIAKTLAPQFKKLSLELGGKNPNIIFADCDYNEMLNTTLKSSFANQGQICLCGSRIFIEDSLYEKFKTDFVNKTKALKVGNPNTPVNLGALISESHLEKVAQYVAIAKEDGGKILCGGHRISVKGLENGYYYAPTIIEVKSNTCRINQEEVFGPVVTILPFKTELEALKMANDVPYGLSATIWTTHLQRAHRMATQIQAGIVWVNTWLNRDLRTPFGGVKASGLGREGGLEALRFFTEPKNVCIQY